MADFSDIVDEMETIANAFTSINYFDYNRVSYVNGKQKAKGYPSIYVSSAPDTVRGVTNELGLPRDKRYVFNIFCRNLYNTADQRTKTLQEAQAEVDLWLDQYIAQFFSRNIDACNGFYIVDREQITGFLAHDVHNDKLVQSTYRVTVGLQSGCDGGTFNY